MTASSINQNKQSRLVRIVYKIMPAAFWLVVWQIVYLTVGKEILVVSPITVFRLIVEMAQTTAFWRDTLTTVGRTLLGFSAGVAVGTLLAALTCVSAVLRDFMTPLLSMIRATPVASFILLALVWMKTGAIPVFTTVLIVVPVVWANVSEGIHKTDVKLLEMAAVYKFGTIKKIKLIYVPSVSPYLAAACATGLGLAWKAAVAAEVLCVPRDSVGANLRDARIYLETDRLFAWTTVVIVLSVFFEKLLKAVAVRIKR